MRISLNVTGDFAKARLMLLGCIVKIKLIRNGHAFVKSSVTMI